MLLISKYIMDLLIASIYPRPWQVKTLYTRRRFACIRRWICIKVTKNKKSIPCVIICKLEESNAINCDFLVHLHNLQGS